MFGGPIIIGRRGKGSGSNRGVLRNYVVARKTQHVVFGANGWGKGKEVGIQSSRVHFMSSDSCFIKQESDEQGTATLCRRVDSE